MVKIAIISNAIMYFLYRFQMKKMKVFMGFTNQLKDVFGRLRRREGERNIAYVWIRMQQENNTVLATQKLKTAKC